MLHKLSCAFLSLVLLWGTAFAQQEKTTTAADGVRTLQGWYSQASGLYDTAGWWNSANAITVLANYSRVSGDKSYLPVFTNTLEKAQSTPKGFKGFINKFYDDEGWWALAWIDAYDLTKDARYEDMAASIFADMAGGWDSTCGGGIWWSKDRKYKNAIANELFLSVAAHLASRAAGDERKKYLDWAQKEWAWFSASGMINAQYLINDGLTLSTCKNNQQNTWTYNQGVILGGLAELNRIAPDASLPEHAKAIAAAALAHFTDTSGILHDTCEPDCGGDGIQFKGIFMRNLMELNESLPDSRYEKSIEANAESILKNAQGPHHQFGEVWSGPFKDSNAVIQASALDVLIAAEAVK